jgi:hypothetical protein
MSYPISVEQKSTRFVSGGVVYEFISLMAEVNKHLWQEK